MAMSLEAELELDATAERVNLNDLYMIRLNKPRYISKELYKYIAKRTVAQALLQLISTSPGGLVLREIYPKYDFATMLRPETSEYHGNGLPISNDWRQPASMEWVDVPCPNPGHCYHGVEPKIRTWDDIDTQREGNLVRGVYWTNYDTRYNRKVMSILGFQNLHIDEEVNVSTIDLRHGDVKLVGMDNVESINNRGILFFHKPWLIRASDEARFDFWLKDGVIGQRKHDQLQVVGMLCETAGSMMAG